jgi:hypothetical protein
MMDETRLRAVIREEIALAVKTLAEQMWSSDPEDTGASFEQAASSFGIYAYRGACEAADADRAEDARNPFEEPEPEAVDDTTKAYVRGEIGNAFRALSVAASDLDMPYETSELDSRSLNNIERAADRALANYKQVGEAADE